MDQATRDRVVTSLVRVRRAPEEHGMGFVAIGGGYVFTAAHCLPRFVDPVLSPGDPLCVEVCDFNGSDETVLSLVRFMEPCSDIAVLGNASWRLDLYDLPMGDEDAYAEFLARRPLLTLCVDDGEMRGPFDVHVFTVEREWLSGQAKANPLTPFLATRFSKMLPAGTSGAPVFDDQGHVVGLVTHTTDNGKCGVVWLAGALPRWAILEASEYS